MREKRTAARSPTPKAGAPRPATTTMEGGLPWKPAGRPSISPSRSRPVISTTPISGNSPGCAKDLPPRGWDRLFGCFFRRPGWFLLGGLFDTRSFRFPGLGLRSGLLFASFLGAVGQKLDCAVHGEFLGCGVARQRRVDAVMADTNPALAVEDFPRPALGRVVAQLLDRFGRAAAEFLRLGQQHDRAAKADGQHVIGRRERFVFLSD